MENTRNINTYPVTCSLLLKTVVILTVVVWISTWRIITPQEDYFTEENDIWENEAIIVISDMKENTITYREELFSRHRTYRYRRLVNELTDEQIMTYIKDNPESLLKLSILINSSKSATTNESIGCELLSVPAKEIDAYGSLQNDSSAGSILEMLDEGAKKVLLGESKEFVLVLGNTGCGKTTITQLLTGNENMMHAKKLTTGDFIITDENNKIGVQTLVSKTIFPELVIEETSNTSFYDCPGFSDTRSTAHDISATYFIKTIVDHAEKVKILFLVIYPAVRVGVDRQDFKRLLEHINGFVKNITRFRNSMALVVTKVSNYNDAGHFMQDEDIIRGIVQFLQDVKQTMQNELRENFLAADEKTFIEKSLIFIDIILTQKNGKYIKIGISRSPNECGRLSEIPLIMNAKKSLEDLYRKKIFYVTKLKDDFGFTLADKSKLAISPLIQEINYQISNLTTDIVNEERLRVFQDSNNCDLVKCNIYYGKRHSFLFKRLKKIANTTNVNEFFHKLSFKFKSTSGSCFKIKFANQENYLQFFERITEKKVRRDILLWKSPLERLLVLALESKTWYDFLSSLYDSLSSYEVQNNPAIKTQAENIVRSALGNMIKHHNETFLSLIKGYGEVQAVIIDLKKYNELSAIITYTMLQEAKFFCSNEKNEFVVEGNFVKVSDVTARVLHCPGRKFIKIFSLDTVFIDDDLKLPDLEIHVTLFAPKWEVLGKREFYLQGEAGKNHSAVKAENGATVGDMGHEGMPGLPGGNGGSFIGLVDILINGEFLVINVNGGNGGQGQHGGEGHSGEDGDSMTFEQSPDPHSNHDDSVSETGDLENYGPYHKVNKVFSGKPGGNGGNGGNGGLGGEGGNPGEAKIFVAGKNRDPLNVTIYQLRGKMGKPGIGGIGGRGGDHGNGLNVTFKLQIVRMKWDNPKTIFVNVSAPAGTNGSNGYNDVNQIFPREIRILKGYDDIIRYKIFYLLNLPETNLKNFDMQSFYRNLASNFYDVFAFGMELETLERNFFLAKNKTFYLESYQELLDRINYYLSHTYSAMSLEQNITFAVIKAAVFSKICNSKSVFGIGLVTNVSGYFDGVIKKIQELEYSSQLKIKNDLKDQYQKEYEYKIVECLNFINTDLLPNIEELQSNVNSQVKVLLNQAADLIDRERNNKNDLNKLKTGLDNTMLLRSVFGLFKIAGQIISFVGPQGATAGAVIGATTFVAEPFILDGDLNNEKPLTFPPVIQKIMLNIDEKIKSQKELEIFILNEKISAVGNLTSKHSKILENFDKEIKKHKDIIKAEEATAGYYANSMSTIRLQEAKKSLQNVIEEKIKELESGKKSVDEKTQNALKDLQTANNVARTIEVAYDIYTKLKYDKNKINKIADMLLQSDRKITAMSLHKEKINIELIPLVNKLRSDMINITNSLTNSSRSDFSGIRWKVQNILKDFKANLKQFTNGFPVEEKFLQYLESLNEAINVLIDLFSKLQIYQEQKKLADYIKNINSVDVSTMNVNDPNLISLIKDLSLAIQSNIFLGEYERALSVFKQWMFPFAHFYLEEFSISFNSSSSDRKDIEMVRNAYTSAIKKLKDKLNVYKNEVFSGQDRYTRKGLFSSDTLPSKPFFVWEHNEWNETLTNLLAGKPVKMYADVTKSVKNAVKFTKVEIKFKVTNSSVQNDIENKLARFSVSLTHNGNSYFKVDNKYYSIRSESVTMKYNFEKKNENYVSVNRVHEKLSAGDYMLSPYTLWDIQLHKESDQADFRDLEIYAGNVSLELFGNGLYVDNATDFSQLFIDDYYLAD